MIVMLIVIALFIGIGLVFINGKGSSLIAGFNTMPPEEKVTYDTVALCKFMGKMMFVLSFCLVFCLLSELYAADWLLTVGIVLFIGTVAFMLIYANTGNRFKK